MLLNPMFELDFRPTMGKMQNTILLRSSPIDSDSLHIDRRTPNQSHGIIEY